MVVAEKALQSTLMSVNYGLLLAWFSSSVLPFDFSWIPNYWVNHSCPIWKIVCCILGYATVMPIMTLDFGGGSSSQRSSEHNFDDNKLTKLNQLLLITN